jgi:hypothetical protein
MHSSWALFGLGVYRLASPMIRRSRGEGGQNRGQTSRQGGVDKTQIRINGRSIASLNALARLEKG